ncbi:hypothetical protein PQO03_00460 [Lentisphaera profundi]|jgi:hypothetical protein|uniref:Uncharacterized protein n=1 Tax=Lentisphaera profundi TaxID=1658616 RepID=A0ABY7VQH2_9BACT|nr:hypothetical protein [Lentisphaera profundi]WDE96435.1 hypothetical protein PQO03_00460 [Lentisphaera profundi]
MNRKLTSSNRRRNTDVMLKNEQHNPMARDTFYDLIFNRSTLNEKIQGSQRKGIIYFILKYLLLRPMFLILSWYVIIWLSSHLADEGFLDITKFDSWFFALFFITTYALLLILFKPENNDLNSSIMKDNELSEKFRCLESDIKLIKASRYIEVDFYREHVILNSEQVDNIIIKIPFKIDNLDKYVNPNKIS